MDQLPIEPTALAPFFLAVLLIELTPGPNMGYFAALSASQGRVAGFKAVFGITLGLLFYMLLAVVGVAEIIATAPLLYGLLRWAGVAYLLYLAWEAWRGAHETSPGHAKDVDHAPFWRGLIANVLNPKALVFYVALLPGFIAPDHASFWVQALMLGSLHIAISFIVHSLIVVGSSHAGAFIAKSQHAVQVRQALALGIAAIAVWLAWETR